MKASIRVPWPARLDGEVSLVLHLKAETVRTSGDLVAMRITRSEFRTRGEFGAIKDNVRMVSSATARG